MEKMTCYELKLFMSLMWPYTAISAVTILHLKLTCMLKKNIVLLVSKNAIPTTLAKNRFPAVSVPNTFCCHLTENVSGLIYPLTTAAKLLLTSTCLQREKG